MQCNGCFSENSKKKQHVRSRTFQARCIYWQLLPLTQTVAVAPENIIQVFKSSQVREYNAFLYIYSSTVQNLHKIQFLGNDLVICKLRS